MARRVAAAVALVLAAILASVSAIEIQVSDYVKEADNFVAVKISRTTEIGAFNVAVSAPTSSARPASELSPTSALIDGK